MKIVYFYMILFFANSYEVFAQTNSNSKLSNEESSTLGIEVLDSKSLEEKIALLSKAANEGNIDAQYDLAIMYKYGWGVEKDSILALEYFENAADEGHIEAGYHAGTIYYYGTGVETDYNLAANYLKMAAEGEHAGSQYRLGTMYFNGLGVEQDYIKAAVWLRMARFSGFANATVLSDIIKDDLSVSQINESYKQYQELFDRIHQPSN